MTDERPPWTPEMKEHAREHYRLWRERYRSYADEINLLLNPLRRDYLELLKESSAWARLAMQYALIVNAGALAALPYLLVQGKAYQISPATITCSAYLFAAGLLQAAVCCFVAYLDFQVTAERYMADWDTEMHSTQLRHFEDEALRSKIPLLAATAARYQKARRWTSICGVLLGLGSWATFAWGALQLIPKV